MTLLLCGLGAVGACVSQPFVVPLPPSAPALVAAPARLERDVRKFVEASHPRGHEQLENLHRAAACLGAELGAAGGP